MAQTRTLFSIDVGVNKLGCSTVRGQRAAVAAADRATLVAALENAQCLQFDVFDMFASVGTTPPKKPPLRLLVDVCHRFFRRLFPSLVQHFDDVNVTDVVIEIQLRRSTRNVLVSHLLQDFCLSLQHATRRPFQIAFVSAKHKLSEELVSIYHDHATAVATAFPPRSNRHRAVDANVLVARWRALRDELAARASHRRRKPSRAKGKRPATSRGPKRRRASDAETEHEGTTLYEEDTGGATETDEAPGGGAYAEVYASQRNELRALGESALLSRLYQQNKKLGEQLTSTFFYFAGQTNDACGRAWQAVCGSRFDIGDSTIQAFAALVTPRLLPARVPAVGEAGGPPVPLPLATFYSGRSTSDGCVCPDGGLSVDDDTASVVSLSDDTSGRETDMSETEQ